MIRRPYLLLTVFMLACLRSGSAAFADEYHLASPNNRIAVTISIAENTTFSVRCNANTLISDSPISLELGDGTVLGEHARVAEAQNRTVNEVVIPVVKEKRERIVDFCNELRLEFENSFALVFRAYDNGVAYRFETSLAERVTIMSEKVSFNFTDSDTAYFPEEESFFSHNERSYKKVALNQVQPGKFCSLPVLVKKVSGIHVLITESDLDDYPGLWLEVNGRHTFSGIFPAVVLEEKQESDRDLKVVKRADFIAQTEGGRSYPWRVMAIAETDTDLLTNQLVYLLSKPLQLQDTSWIKPGKVAWDWWNALNLYGVDFESGVNTETYKYFIDFASKYGIEYIILDEGWYKLGNVLSITPTIAMEELLAYSREKSVGIILWVIWKTLDNQLEAALDRFAKWGVKGIKVDFMQRDDQWMVNYYRKIAAEAAKRKLLVDFHGAYKPSGLRRAYPNVITREGVKGLEWNKWSEDITPQHNVTLPFIRMVAGPMDYTPGAVLNAQKENFRIVYSRPMSMGTRCHQLAMYVVYESPLQMLADSPSNYLREPECMAFLAAVPTVWDEIRVLHAKVADYLVVARRNQDDWYVGAMTDENPRELLLDFSFLQTGDYIADIFQDGVNAHRHASDYKRTTARLSKSRKLKIKLAPGGGWAARIRTQ